MDRSKVIHELIDELGDSNFRQIAVRLVPNQPHRENVAERCGNQVRILADKQLQASCEIFVCSLVV